MSVSASRSVATATSTLAACAVSMKLDRSVMAPRSSGYCSSTPKTAASSTAISATGPTRSSMPRGSARLRSTASVCGKTRSEARNTPPVVSFLGDTRCSSVIASPAAVASSSSEAVATGNPVRSLTMVWKLSSDSSRPWAISAW